ncbi:2-keto-4-pentenoate hydratase [Pseudonocardia sp. H11422]|uniref:2-keto-4-pentenoate hydratase n=1 Tax=Pseudonocardia sp. H11422 TaxID=2835866 RepID=UPI001BDD16B1|nr:fumarylacetoacetate hydrolase family protein [Pseudonocardia sp. H11422]
MTDPQTMADALIEAERARTPVVPFTRAHPFLDAETAYKAQRLVVEHRLQDGEGLIGWKLGMTSRVKRDALGIHEPVYGRLTSGMLVPAAEPLPLGQLIHPRAEPEIAFLIGERIEGPVTAAGVIAATEAVVAAVEVMDSRYSDRFRLPDSIADNAAAARIVLGSRPCRPSDLVDLRLVGCVFRSRGEVVDTAAGGAVMGDPAAAVAWLANTLAAKGEHLPAGSIVLSGGLTASVPLIGGDNVTAEFDGLGSVEVHS